jgi:hypothetical protein
VTGFSALLELARAGFTAPSFALFSDLLIGWVLAPGRRTITGMIAIGDPGRRRAHDAYHRLVRDGAWSMTGLWRVLAIHAIGSFAPTGVVPLDCDDTLFHKSGRNVEGAGIFRDAVRSTVRKVVSPSPHDQRIGHQDRSWTCMPAGWSGSPVGTHHDADLATAVATW